MYDESEEGRDAYIAAAKAAFKRHYAAPEKIIRAALERGRQARLGA